MAATRILQVRLTKAQQERIRSDTYSHGCKTMAEYARSVLLGSELLTAQKIHAIYETVVGDTKKKKNLKSNSPMPKERALLLPNTPQH